MKTTAQKIIDMALSMGANECEVILNRGTSLSLKANDGELEEHKVSGTQVVGVRLKSAGRLGSSYSESFDEDSLRAMIKTALDTSKYSKLSEYESICVTDDGNKSDATTKATWLEDQHNDQDKIALALKLEADVRARDKRIKSAPYNSLSEGTSERLIANHLGVFRTIKHRTFSGFTSALVDTEGKQSMHYYGGVGLTLDQLDIKKFVDVSCEHALGLLDGSAVKTGKYSVVFDTDTLNSLWGAFMNIFSAKAAIDKVNPWAKKLGETVATTNLTLIDHPSFDGGMGFQAFDDEGFESKPLTLIENGVLKNFLHNSATAKELGVSNNGRAGRGPRSPLGVSSTQLVFNQGSDSESTVLAGEFLEIISLQGLHSGVDVISGDYSFGGSGYLVRDGKRVQAVRNITISGNFYETIKDISALGTDIHSNSQKTFFAPLMRFEGISIAGA